VQRPSRESVQTAARVGALVFVVLWLLSSHLQGAIPFWLAFAILAVTEVEFLVGGMRERRYGAASAPASRRLPGAADADLGWIEVPGEDGETQFVPAEPRPRRRTHLHFVPVAIVALGLFVWAYLVDRESGWQSLPAATQAQAERRFTAEATRIARRPVTVRCDDGYAYTGVGSDAAGVAFIPRALAYLQPTVCRSLYRIAFEQHIGARDDAAFAITVLAHEATHLRGISNEAETECYALQEGVALARRLGVDAATAQALMRAQRDRDLSDASIARLDYRLPAGCRDGGALDLRPNDSTFP
jgi:hypothetical protein